MLGASLTGSVMSTLVRHATVDLHPFEVAFLRSVFGVLFMLPWLLTAGRESLRTTRYGLYFWRTVIAAISMIAWFYGVAFVPLAEATALGFTAPLFATVMAALFLREVIRIRRWSATVIGFLGVLVIVRPGWHPIDVPTLAVLLSSVAAAFSVLIIKRLSRTESANAIVAYTMIFLTPITLVAAIPVWTTPSWYDLAIAAAIGFIGTIGNICMTRSLAATDTSAVLPFEYVRLPLVALVAYLAFGEVPDVFVWIGGVIIAASSIYIAHREATLAREKVRPPAAKRE
jgi:drug/metabolite transporter (DMT)-like permease